MSSGKKVTIPLWIIAAELAVLIALVIGFAADIQRTVENEVRGATPFKSKP